MSQGFSSSVIRREDNRPLTASWKKSCMVEFCLQLQIQTQTFHAVKTV